MVRVTIAGTTSEHFFIHRQLLLDKAPSLSIERNEPFEFQATTEHYVETEVFQMFVRFLYGGKIVREPVKEDQDMDTEMQTLMAAYYCGQDVGCGIFMDAITDEIIDRLTSRSYPFCITIFVDELLAELRNDSPFWDFAFDYILYFENIGCDNADCEIYSDLGNVRDEGFLRGLGRRALEARGCHIEHHMLTPEGGRTIAVGFREEFNHRDPSEEERYPWKVNRCQYHQHGEDQHCYASTH